MDAKTALKDFGLSEGEAKVYLALLELGPSLAGAISRKTGIHRRNVYDITERLIKKGLIGYILKNNRKFFEASDPKKFLDVIKERENQVDEVLPELNELFGRQKEKQETNFYKGKDGLKTIFQDQLNGSKDILIIGASPSAFELLPFYFKWYDIERARKKIKARIIASGHLNKKIPLSEIRILPHKYENPLAVNIYKDKVALILWKKEPIVILIKNSEIADSYRKYFELLWHTAKKIS